MVIGFVPHSPALYEKASSSIDIIGGDRCVNEQDGRQEGREMCMKGSFHSNQKFMARQE